MLIYSIECVFQIKSTLPIMFYSICEAVCLQRTHLFGDD